MANPTGGGFAAQRRDELLHELRAHGALQVTEMSRRLGVSEVTLRRDVNALVNTGVAERVHGGAVLRDRPAPARGVGAEPRFTIGMVAPSTNYYWPTIFADARSVAAELGVQLVVRASTYAIDDHQKQIAKLVTLGVDALITAPDTDAPGADRLLRWLDELAIPVVLAERMPMDPGGYTHIEWVASDHTGGARLAVDHLVASGHHRIGLFDLGTSNPTVPQLRRGWSEQLIRHGIAPEDQLTGNSVEFVSDHRDAAIDDVLARCAETGTTALIILPDPYAVLFVQRAQDVGVRIPDDLSIVAYDDEVAHTSDPPLSAVHPPKRYIGRQAVELAVARLAEGIRRPPHRVSVGAQLVVRSSSGPAPTT